MSYKDYYQVLGVARDASAQTLQKRYRALAKKYHPDVSKEPDAEARFKEIGEAYEVLRDEKKRSLYDKWGPNWRAISEGRGPPPGGPRPSEVQFDFGPFGFDPDVSDINQIFEQVFGGRRPGRQRGRGAPRQRQKDQETILELGVADGYRGGRRDLQFGDVATGTTRSLSVNVPAGVRDGQRIRLGGQASGGGDLYLKVAIVRDARLRLEGDDVYVALRVSPHEAVLGASVPLETLDGNVKIKVPPGSSTGRQIRMRGRGYPKRGGERGDLYAEVQIVVPTEPSEDERALYEKLAEASTFDPRER